MRVMQTTSTGLDHSILPMRLYHKAKKLVLGIPKTSISPKIRRIGPLSTRLKKGCH